MLLDDSSTKFKRIYVNKADLRNMWWTRGSIAQAVLWENGISKYAIFQYASEWVFDATLDIISWKILCLLAFPWIHLSASHRDAEKRSSACLNFPIMNGNSLLNVQKIDSLALIGQMRASVPAMQWDYPTSFCRSSAKSKPLTVPAALRSAVCHWDCVRVRSCRRYRWSRTASAAVRVLSELRSPSEIALVFTAIMLDVSV